MEQINGCTKTMFKRCTCKNECKLRRTLQQNDGRSTKKYGYVVNKKSAIKEKTDKNVSKT